MNAMRHKLKGLLAVYFLFIATSFLSAQGIGSWRTYLPFYDVTDIAETPNKVFGLASGSLFSYSPDDQEVKKYGKQDGLNGVEIQFMAYSGEADALLVVYKDCNVDILTNKDIYNFTGIITADNIEDKSINGVDVQGKMAYISTSFGIVVLDLEKKESPDSYKIGNVLSTCVKDNYIYTATFSGIRRGLLSKNLASKDNWEDYWPAIDDLQTWNLHRILSFKDALIFQQNGGGIFYKTETSSGVLSYEGFKNTKLIGEQLIGIAGSSVFVWSSLDEKTEIKDLSVSDISSQKQKKYWIGQNKEGFGAIEMQADKGAYTSLLSNITFNGPMNNRSFTLRFQNNKLLVTGGRSGNEIFNYPGTFMVLENGVWQNFDKEEIEAQVREKYPEIPDYECRDLTEAIEDPARPGRYYVSSNGEGLYVFEDGKLETLYNLNNSPLVSVLNESAEPDEALRKYQRYHYIWTFGMDFDKENNLHVSLSRVNGPVQILSAQKTWANVPYQNLGLYDTPIRSLIITKKQQKWINFLRSGRLLLIEDNNTPFDFSDDKTLLITGSLTDQKGESFAYGNVRSIVEDQKGAIWIGTERGPAIFYNPTNAIQNPNNFYCTRPILPYNDGSDNGFYLLETEQINAVAVDGANRKWLGTERSGVYLVSENGMEMIANFTEENSPLPSNTIFSIAVDSHTGEVFFATDKGLVSYMGDASMGKSDYDEVRAYPNPVRPEYQDVVTVTNLVKDSNVKITDTRGNLIYQGTSKGGMFTWKCVDNKGERVKTGVYLVYAATPDGSEGVVSKIMVVK